MSAGGPHLVMKSSAIDEGEAVHTKSSGIGRNHNRNIVSVVQYLVKR